MRIKLKRFCTYVLISMLMANLSGTATIFAEGCMNLADMPLEIAHIQGPPGLIFFVVDNSYSMGSEIMTKNIDVQGYLQDDPAAGIECVDIGDLSAGEYGYEYIFNGTGSGTFDELDDSPTDKYLWKVRWNGYNKIYYNPSAKYDPWPRWVEVANIKPSSEPLPPTVDELPYAPNAHPDSPRIDPQSSKTSFDLNAVWATIELGNPGTAPIVTVDDDVNDDDSDGFSRTGGWASIGYLSAFEDDYLHTTSTATFTAAWTADLDPDEKYNVFARWRAMANRSTDVEYSIKHGTTATKVTVNQEVNGDQWNKLAGDVSFPTGVGYITLQHTPYSDAEDRACADAIRFVPSCIDSTGSVDIVQRHYYVHNDNGTFLVNLNGGFGYYQFNDVDGDNRIDSCELKELTPEQADSVGIVTGRSFEEEKRNFANWFQFHRTRTYTVRYAMAQVAAQMSNVCAGYVTVPESNYVGLRSINVDFRGQQLDRSSDFLLQVYMMGDTQSSAPLAKGLDKVGGLFNGTDSSLITSIQTDELKTFTSTDKDYYPFFTEENGGGCQQAFAIVLTDGAQDFQGPNIGNTDIGDTAQKDPYDSEFDGGKYADNFEDTLADIAMKYYEKDMRDIGGDGLEILPDNVPTNEFDNARHQHMVTYGLTFGVQSQIDPDAYPNCASLGCTDGSCCPEWPDPNDTTNKLAALDDLYHATVNGRGRFLNASDPQELVNALLEIKADIEFRLGSGSAVTTNAVQRQIGAKIYQGIYHSGSWWGTLLSKPVDVDTGNVGQAEWDTRKQLELLAPDDRTIFTMDSVTGAGIPFRYAQLNSEQQTAVVSEEILNYLRGDDSFEEAAGGPYRNREGKLGDIVHSEPYFHEGVIYIGANDGMLHAFDAETGDELFAYVPSLVYDKLAQLSDPHYLHKYFVDATPYARSVSQTQDLLAGGLGKGGKGVYCLDVSNALSSTLSEADAASIVKWEYTAASDDDLGYTYGRSYIAETAAGWVVIFGNGYDSVNQKAVLYALNAQDGTVMAKIDTGVAGCNGLSSPTIIDPNFDGIIDYVYAGDLQGNLWKFDFRSSDPANWGVAYSDGTNPKPLFTAKNAAGTPQPITSEPDLMEHCEKGRAGYMVIFGTGSYLSETDLSDTSVQSLYGLYDWGKDWVIKAELDGLADPESADDLKYMGEFTAMRNLSNVADATLLQQTVAYEDADYMVLTDNLIDYYSPYDSTGSHAGWYFNLPSSGERMVEDPLIRRGVAVYVSNIPDSSNPCGAGGTSVIYQLDACSGGRTEASQFDRNGDGKYDENDKIDLGDGEKGTISGKKEDTILYAPVELGDHLYINDATGNILETPVPDDPARMSYWWLLE